MSGGVDLYKEVLESRRVGAIAMSALASGALSDTGSLSWVCNLPEVQWIVFGVESTEYSPREGSGLQLLGGDKYLAKTVRPRRR